MAAVTIEVRRTGVLPAIIEANSAFVTLFPSGGDSDEVPSHGLYAGCGLGGLEVYIQKLVKISTYHMATMSEPVSQDEWSIDGSLYNLLLQNPFDASLAAKVDEFSGEAIYMTRVNLDKLCSFHIYIFFFVH